ncbi:HECT domain-containing family protein [Cryptosporidium serpentis]
MSSLDEDSTTLKKLLERCLHEYLIICKSNTDATANALRLYNSLTITKFTEDEKALIDDDALDICELFKLRKVHNEVMDNYIEYKKIQNCLLRLKSCNYSLELYAGILEDYNIEISSLVNMYSNFYILNKIFFTSNENLSSHRVDFIHLGMFSEWMEKLHMDGVCLHTPIYYNNFHDECPRLLTAIQYKIICLCKDRYGINEDDIVENVDINLNNIFVGWYQLRFLLILFNGAIFEHGFGDFAALRCILQLIYRMPETISDIIYQWFVEVPLVFLENCVSTIQQMLSVRLYEFYDNMDSEELDIMRHYQRSQIIGIIARLKPKFQSDVKLAFSLLRIIYRANNTRMMLYSNSDLLNINNLDISSFYNEAINSAKALLQHELRQWLLNPSSNNTDFELFSNPYILQPWAKAQALQQDSLLQQRLEFQSSITHALGSVESLFAPSTLIEPFLLLRIRRDSIIRDSMEQLSLQNNLKKQLKVTFIGEEGVDEGGVQKEFFQLLVQEIFKVDFGMFIYYENTRLFWFNMASLESDGEFELIGVILALAIYNGIILDVHFPLAVYKKLLGFKTGIRDLYEIQPGYARSLISLLSITDSERFDDLCLTFSTTINNFGEFQIVALSPELYNADEPVTIENVQIYIDCYIDWFFNKSIKRQFAAFYNGFHSICGGRALELFSPQELVQVICGSSKFDLDSLINATKYQDGYTKDSETVKYFWEVVREFDVGTQKKLLFFVTGSDRIPMKGLGDINFIIGRFGPDSNMLPTAHTCFNYLLLPDYNNKEKLRKLLLISLEHSQGFGLK